MIAQSGPPKAAVQRVGDAMEVDAMKRKYKAEKKKTQVFQDSEKNIMISRENQILLSKLVDISNGKWSSVPAANSQPRKRVATSQHSR